MSMTDRSSFDWDVARTWLAGLPGGGLNIAHEAVDRHVREGHGDWVAFRFLGKRGGLTQLTYAELAAETDRFAGVLRDLGVAPGERVFLLSGRIRELYVAALGSLKAGCVVSPMFSAFGPEPIRQRITLGDGRVLVTTPELYQRKVAAMRDGLPTLAHVLVAGDTAPEGTLALTPLLADTVPIPAILPTDPLDPALLHFTSGTTGTPKGALHVHEAVVAHHATGRLVLGLQPGDVYWCTADPGWVTGTSYGIVAPLTCGVTSVVDEAEFDAERWYSILRDERVTVWYTAPTAIRMLMKAGDDLARAVDLSSVRFAASVGEPLNPEAVIWSTDVLHHTFHDNWWQTETGGIMIANRPGSEVRPGSMGTPIPGITAGVLACSDEGVLTLDPAGAPIELTEPDQVGMLALRAGWPSMFRAYLNDEERYRKAFRDAWYLTGDLVRRDADGYYWFVGRADDVIKTAGHLIGPFEVESALMEHDAVAEAGAYGVPDEVAGALVHAAIALRPGFAESDDLVADVMAHARRRLGPAVAPRRILVLDDLPKTRSGKVMRRVLRARELGLPEGDLSTMEPGAS
jgi:acetyl-CoA synthetase